MAAPFFTLIFCSVLGALLLAYFSHFRRRARIMGPERLRAALARTVASDEEASEDDLRDGLLELESRLRKAVVLNSAALAVILGACILLTALSAQPRLVLALAGVSILLTCTMTSLMMLRDIPRFLRRHLEEGSAGD